MSINSTPALEAALALAKAGDRITLEPGAYAKFGWRDKAYPGVTIAAAGPVTVAGVELLNVSGLTLAGLGLRLDPVRTKKCAVINKCSRIVLNGCDLRDAPGSLNGGALVIDSQDVALLGCAVTQVSTALQIVNSPNVAVTGNDFHDITGDGVQSTGSSFVTISGNHFTDFHPSPGDHPDAIQFFTLNQKAPATDLTITDNVYVRGAGVAVQGIFMGDEIFMPYRRVTITGNTIIGGLENGITAYGEDFVVSDNIVQGYVDQGSGIVIDTTTNAKVTNNRSTGYTWKPGSVGQVDTGNTRLAKAAVGDVSMLPGAPPIPAPPPPPPPAVDTRDDQIKALTAAGLAELVEVKAARDAALADLKAIAALATQGKKLTSAATMRPVLDQILALTAQ